MDRFPIVIGCDCDPDRVGFSSDASHTELNWQGISAGIPVFRDTRRRFYDRTGIWPRMTWFVRADLQIEQRHGDAGYCLRRFGELWQALVNEGDEIAWHPHLWDWDDKLKRWCQRFGDTAFTRNCLLTGFEAFKAAWGCPPATVHAGWCFQDNITLAFMAEYGLLADCSAVPGHNTLGHGIADQADWYRAPALPYWPAKQDYQRPAESRQDSLGILEIPTSVGSNSLARAFKIFRDQLKRRSLRIRYRGFRSQVPLMTLTNWLNGPLLDDAVRRVAKADRIAYFFSYMHCDEFLTQSNKSGLARLIYSLDDLFRNIQRVHARVAELSVNPICQTASELAAHLRQVVPVASAASKATGMLHG